MIIKKYVADTMNEALNLIRYELGPEAVIVSKRSIRQKGVMGLFLPKKLEVTAAIDESSKEDEIPEEETRPFAEELSKAEIEQEISEVKVMLQQLVENKEESKSNKKNRKNHGIKRILSERDVSEEVIEDLVNKAKEKDKYKGSSRLPDKAVIEEIEDRINVEKLGEGRLMAFVGPTGVGKTTTIAKLAALKALSSGKKVGLITIDTYRIGAVEQLRIYADILGLPFEVINHTRDVEKSIKNLSGCDYIYIDTTGRSVKNLMQLSELRMYLDKLKPDSITLVVSMTTKYNDLLKILDGFSAMNYDNIILTKFDETTTYGSILNVISNTKAPVSYIAIGQNVPDDIEEATKEKLLDLILGEGAM
ncbi:flagellar biosynthesis protein FlhF [Oxobacter pfennigii]|uniref:Flagellar biosynthesis protein FlhF n=1 Tax=Oxobacter pfennigii TaxID=36849 RepID=A0A0P9AGY6_9CLOT|nr:flagellar biosynthesis protein FlhF [Oxobacter pfennigii]KPU44705.1 flagellar biosynthesis protein FlhF [Oxobacter pfennigii]